MQEMEKIRYTLKEDLERKYFDLVEQKKTIEREREELKVMLNSKSKTIKEIERKYEMTKESAKHLEE